MICLNCLASRSLRDSNIDQCAFSMVVAKEVLRGIVVVLGAADEKTVKHAVFGMLNVGMVWVEHREECLD